MPNDLNQYVRELSLTANETLNLYLGELNAIYEEVSREINRIVNGDYQLIEAKGEPCWVCGRHAVHLHHIAGRKHDERTIPLCEYCHAQCNADQRTWGNGWTKRDRPERLRKAFFFKGLQYLLKLRAEELWHMNMTIMAHMYDDIADLYNLDIARMLDDTED